MTFNYSTCYPDTDIIEYHRQSVTSDDILEIFKKHDWNGELKKELKFYSPSLEVNRLEDKVKLIISGLGKGKLDEFMLMLLVSKKDSVKDEFEYTEYKGAKQYEGRFSTTETRKILDLFLKGQTKVITARFNQKIEVKTSDRPMSTLEIWIARIGGILLSILMIYVFILLIIDDIMGWPLVIAGGFMAIFIIGSIRFEVA